MTNAVHIVLDDSAMVAAGRGNMLASRLIHRAHAEPGWFLYASTCALVEADRSRPGTAEHIASLPRVVVLELDLSAALAIASDLTWAGAHTRYAAEPNAERPDGALVATMNPASWRGVPARLLDLSP